MRILTPLFLVTLLTNVAPAQIGISTTYNLLPVQGTVVSVSRRGIVMEVDGKQGPVPMNRNTTIRVEATGDPGFVRKGAVVTVNGAVAGKSSLTNASITVHMNPRQTARQRTRIVSKHASEMTITGVIVSLNPLVINATDLIEMEVGNANSSVGIVVPPVSPGKIQVQPSQATKERVNLSLGNAINLIAAEDRITYYYRQGRPNLAERVIVRKQEPLKSPAAKAKEAQASKASDTDTSTD